MKESAKGLWWRGGTILDAALGAGRPRPARTLTAVFSVPFIAGCSGAAEEDTYAIANGVNAEVDGIEIRSLLIVSAAESRPWQLLGTFFNRSPELVEAWTSAAPVHLIRTLLRFDPGLPWHEVWLAPTLPPRNTRFHFDNVPFSGDGRLSIHVNNASVSVRGLPEHIRLRREPRPPISELLNLGGRESERK